MIETLTSKQWDQVDKCRSSLVTQAKACGPICREEAELAVATVYREKGLQPPREVIWAKSPFEGCVFSEILKTMGKDALGGHLGRQIGGSFQMELSKQFWGKIEENICPKLLKQLSNRFQSPFEDRLRQQLWDQLGENLQSHLWGPHWAHLNSQLDGKIFKELTENLADQRWKNGAGIHSVIHPGFFQFLRVELGLESSEDPFPQIALAKNCGWWWPFQGMVILSEHPISIHLDEEDKLHNEKGMAIEYSDGWGIYSWHGVRIPGDWIENPSSVTARTAVTWENLEQRKVAREIVGLDNNPSEETITRLGLGQAKTPQETESLLSCP